MAELRECALLGVGNPLLDISAVVPADFLAKYGLKADDAILAEEKHQPLYAELVEEFSAEFIAGGSVQNSLRVAQWVLQKPRVTAFFGSVGDDNYAKILREKAASAGVNVQYQYCEEEPTGTCAVLITGSHRSLCANLAAANKFTIDHIWKADNKRIIDAAQYYYISGFFLTVSPPTAMEIAKVALAHDRPFIMNLSAPFISQFFKTPLMELMPYVDILFGNETEAETFAKEQNLTGKDLREISLEICRMPKQNEKRARVVVITQGSEPVLLATEGTVREFPATRLPPEKVVDTNGAGDAFVGGFLAQLVQARDLDVCVRCGIWTATQIVQRSGCTYEGQADFEP